MKIERMREKEKKSQRQRGRKKENKKERKDGRKKEKKKARKIKRKKERMKGRKDCAKVYYPKSDNSKVQCTEKYALPIPSSILTQTFRRVEKLNSNLSRGVTIDQMGPAADSQLTTDQYSAYCNVVGT